MHLLVQSVGKRFMLCILFDMQILDKEVRELTFGKLSMIPAATIDNQAAVSCHLVDQIAVKETLTTISTLLI